MSRFIGIPRRAKSVRFARRCQTVAYSGGTTTSRIGARGQLRQMRKESQLLRGNGREINEACPDSNPPFSQNAPPTHKVPLPGPFFCCPDSRLTSGWDTGYKMVNSIKWGKRMQSPNYSKITIHKSDRELL